MSESIGAILKEARRRRGLRVKDVAARTAAKISPSYLSCIENDLRLPSEDLLLELAELLGLDARDLYLKLILVKAPPSIRDVIVPPSAVGDTSYSAVKDLPLGEILHRAAEATSARRELQTLRRQLQKRDKERAGGSAGSFLERWEADAARFRMRIEKTVLEAQISVEGDLILHRHTIGLTPCAGRKPIVAIQHTATQPSDVPGSIDDDGFKLLEYPADVAIEVERETPRPGLSLFRLLFPDGLAHARGKERRLSYSFRSVLARAYSMEPAGADLVPDGLADDRGKRATFVVAIDKPTEHLEIDLRYPRYYVPHEVEAWAGTQEFYEADDNFIDGGVCASWELRSEVDYRVVLRVERPLVGMKYGFAWKPVYREEYAEAKRRLETGGE